MQKRKPIKCQDTKEIVTSYTKYLNTLHWKIIRIKKLELNHTCEFEGCGTEENINIHHKTYCRLGKEKLTDLVTLCENHHKMIHRNLKYLKKINRKTTRENYLIGKRIYRLTDYRLQKLIEKNKANGIFIEPIKLLHKENTYFKTYPLISLKCKLGMGQLPTIKSRERSYLVFK